MVCRALSGGTEEHHACWMAEAVLLVSLDWSGTREARGDPGEGGREETQVEGQSASQLLTVPKTDHCLASTQRLVKGQGAKA